MSPIHRSLLLVGLAAASVAAPARGPATVDPALIRAHQEYLASDALQGRQSATRFEAMAASYVASQFESFGLKRPPGWASFIQRAPVPETRVTRKLDLPNGAVTTNVAGFLQGTDPSAGTLLITAHLDHLGVRDGKLYPGANDDASGTTAVLELARLLAQSGPHRRSILFAAYGGEELGSVGSTYFSEHPPVPLSEIVANIEFEMIGAADPALAGATLMMTGYDRSTLGEMLKSEGALIGPDPYPGQQFFERSDNYVLAQKGVVAHTIGGWPLAPEYHTPDDTNQHIDFAFMARSIQSLVQPIEQLANTDQRPHWKPGGRPMPIPKSEFAGWIRILIPFAVIAIAAVFLWFSVRKRRAARADLTADEIA